jgi:hypothetical protein
MKVIKQDLGRGESIYSVWSRDTDFPLVVVKVFEDKPTIDAAAHPHMTVYDAAEYAQALMIGIQIVDDLNNGREVTADDAEPPQLHNDALPCRLPMRCSILRERVDIIGGAHAKMGILLHSLPLH